MKIILRPILSLAAIGIFLWFAMASFGSTNTQVQVGECKPKPDFTGKLNILITSRHQDGTLLPNVAGTIFLVHQIIFDTATCQHMVVLSQQIPFNTGPSGSFQYLTPDFTHINGGDLWRAEFNVPAVPGRYRARRSVYVAKYSNTQIHYDFYELQGL
jgi:hypothetical protein